VKKQWTQPKWKAHNRKSAKVSIERRIIHNEVIRRARTLAQAESAPKPKEITRRRPAVEFLAPELLSLTDFPNECVDFFGALYTFQKRRDVFVDLSRVRKITPDAIALLVSLVLRIAQRQNVRISGNYPSDSVMTEMIRASGFDQYLKSSAARTARAKGAILKRDFVLESRQASPQYAQQLINFAAKDDGNISRLKPAYENLLECMGNTHQHAAKSEGTESWWASVFQDGARQCDCFTFVDMGVGIFDSIELGLRLKAYSLMGLGRVEIMRRLLAGEIPSSTRLPYRGKGLPSIHESLTVKHALTRLVIVTDDVYVDVGPAKFETLSRALKGLLLYWEVPHASHSAI
jgi:hypothetical protein